MLSKHNPSNFRHTLICCIIAEQNTALEGINLNSNPPGLKPEESLFLTLIESISNGAKAMVTKGGTLLRFYPGIVTNNEGVQFSFDCGLSRGISYFAEYLIIAAMFGKNTLDIMLTGITDSFLDSSVDTLQNHIIPLLKEHFRFDNELSLKIIKRGYLPEGGGQVHLVVPAIRKLPHINLQDKGYIKRIRAVCSGSKIATSILNEVKDICKTTLLGYLPDVWVHTDFYKGDKASQSPGYSLSLKAETTTGGAISYDSCFQEGTTESFTYKTTAQFLDEVEHSGFVSTNYQWLLLTLMALSQKKTSSLKVGRVSPFTVECLRVVREFFGTTFQIEETPADNLVIFRCLGVGYENYARAAN